jgi:prepilin signal peptidase PulO-like enzyme (type II secretory pathway)
VVLLSDPLAKGWNLLGTAHRPVSYWISEHPTLLAMLKVGSVVTGHVLGVVAAHDRAVRLLPRRHQLTGQLPLLLLMVFFTVTGLSLLFGA